MKTGIKKLLISIWGGIIWLPVGVLTALFLIFCERKSNVLKSPDFECMGKRWKKGEWEEHRRAQ